MDKPTPQSGYSRKRLSRRGFLALGGGALAAAAGARYLGNNSAQASNAIQFSPVSSTSAMPALAGSKNYHLAGTDGWVYLPPASNIPAIYHPDKLAPAPRTTYVFGFRDVTNLTAGQIVDQKGKAQLSAPILFVDEEADIRLTLTNLGLQQRPDLVDSHTIHWHGFRDAIPLFDGVPEMSIAVPIGRDFTYYYKPRAAGTYMYHCHFEDVEHVQMGMTGVIYVRPKMNNGINKYAYNDVSTKYDREFVIFLNELNIVSHWDDAHIQVFDWSEYKADFWTMNGRVYPDTLEANGDPMSTPAPGSVAERLQYQPISSLVQAKSGEKVLLRFVNLGYETQAMTLGGIAMKVVAKDATLLKNGSTDLSYRTNTVYIGPGESYDAIFTAPNVTATTDYLLYNRKFSALNNGGTAGYGGQMTKVRILPSSAVLPAQDIDKPNT